MTNPITPEAVERLARKLERAAEPIGSTRVTDVLDDAAHQSAAMLRALARELAEVKAELDGLTKEQDDKSPPGLIVAQFITIEELQQNIRNLVKERDEWRDEWSAEADRCIAANASLRAARAQIVAAQETKPVAWVWLAPDGRVRSASNEAPDDQHIAHATADGDRIIPVYADPADALAEHDRAVRADERAKCAEVASAETGWDGVPYMSQMQYGPGIGKRIAAAILARGEQEGRG